MIILALALSASASPTPHADVEATLAAFSTAVSASNTQRTRRWLHPSCVQIVQLPDSEMVVDVDGCIGAMESGQIGGSPIDLTVSNIQISGGVATASTVRRTAGFVLVDAVTLVLRDDKWLIASMAVQAGPE